MRLRFVLPWLVSGACHAGRSDAMREVMRRHSLFFQGNDVETGLLAEQLGYRVLHIPFEVNTNVPDTVRSWWRQRLAWAGGEFRLFIANIRLFLRHPWFWFYGAGLAFSLVAFRWYALMRPDWALVLAFVMYCALTYSLHWRERNRWLVLLPLYTLFHSMVLVVLGVFWYFVMAVPEHNYGIIRPTRGSRMDALVSGWSQASRRPGRPVRR
jgi:cellulose synthase/poly-beta-1,6-N-acetylglucosamine synthase-like glycosyltransferase